MLHSINAFDDDAARTALRNWPQTGPIRHIAAVTAAAFSGASIFRVTTDSASYALRRWPPGQMPEARLRELHRFLSFLQAEGIGEVAVPLMGDVGTLIDLEGQLWQLEPWKSGVADFVSAPSDRRLNNVMRVVGRLHVVAARYESTPVGRAWFYQAAAATSPSVEERLDRLADWDANRLRVLLITAGLRNTDFVRWFEWVAPTVRSDLQSVRGTSFRLHPCLRDVWGEHVLFTDQDVSGIIDPSAARTENVAADLSRLLGSFLPEGNERWEAALDAYSAVRPLSLDERRLVRILDRSGVLLSTLHWVEQTGFQPTALKQMYSAERCRSLLLRLERLAGEVGRL